MPRAPSKPTQPGCRGTPASPFMDEQPRLSAWFQDLSGAPLPLDAPRSLSMEELRMLSRVDTVVALEHATGKCEDCGMSTHGVFHKDVCSRKRPKLTPARDVQQPWMPRPSRRAA